MIFMVCLIKVAALLYGFSGGVAGVGAIIPDQTYSRPAPRHYDELLIDNNI